MKPLKKLKRLLRKPKKALKKAHRKSVKLLKRGVQTWIILACLLIATPTGIAAYWIMSNMLTVTVRDFNLELDVSDTNPLRYEIVTFTATLTLAGQPVGQAPILLYRDGIEIMQATTGIDGQADFQVNMTDTANFQARFQAGIIE